MDRSGVAERLLTLIAGQDEGDLGRTAVRLGVEEASLRISVDRLSPHPSVEVLAAVIREYGVDPTWLLTGQYDASTHRTAIESHDLAAAVRDLMGARETRIAEPPNEPRHLFAEN